MGFKVISTQFSLFNDVSSFMEEDHGIIQTELNHRPSASNWKLSHIVFGASRARTNDPSGERQLVLRRRSAP